MYAPFCVELYPEVNCIIKSKRKCPQIYKFSQTPEGSGGSSCEAEREKETRLQSRKGARK